MSVIPPMDEIEKRAATWILKRDREGHSEQDRADLEAWLAQDARHREAYLALDEAWDVSAGLKHWHPRDGRIDPDLLAPFAPPTRPRHPLQIALAASLLLVLGSLGGLYFSGPQAERYSTPVGGYERIALGDGSLVQLNTDTVVQASLTDARREIRLLRGEAYFDVAHDARRPFEVVVGNTIARAVGTAFSVRVGVDRQLDLMVTEGRVMLLPKGGEGSRPLVVAGHSARAKAEEVAVAPVADAEMTRRLAWRSGQLMFDKRPLSEVAEEFNRYNRRQVQIATPGLEALQLTGNFKATDLASFIAAVRSATSARVEETADAVVIRAQQP